jgi:hypothetical protein
LIAQFNKAELCKMAKDDAAIVVFTADTLEKILQERGSGDWVVSAKKADSCQFIVCCRKPNWSNRKEGIPGRAAFLIGRVAGLRERPDSGNGRDQMRYLIQMADHAVFEKPGVWKEGVRNPVAYSTLDDLQIDLSGLKFKPMPTGAEATNESSGAKQMTIADAKNGLAATFGVSPDDIEITIRG